jgi:hypothetical protein
MPRSVSEVTQAECPVNGPPAARGVRCSGRPGRCSAWRPRRSRWRRNGPCLSRRGVQDSVRRTRPAAATRPHTGAITPDQRRHRKVVLHLEVRVPIPRRDHRRDALDTEIHRFRIIYNTIRPHQALGDRTPSTAYTGCDQQKPLDKRQKRALRSSAAQRSLPLARAASSMAASMSVKVPVSILSINGPANRPSGPPLGT